MKLAVSVLSVVVPDFILKHTLFQRVAFIPSLTYNIIRTKLSGREWYSRIDETVILGALPFPYLVNDLVHTEGVSAVVSLNQDFELRFCAGSEHWRSLGVEFLQLPTEDIFAAPGGDKLREGVLFIMDHVSRKGAPCSVYVHCKAGRTRSATLVGCYLMQRYGYTPDECLKFMQAARNQVLLEDLQMAALREYHDKYVKALSLSSSANANKNKKKRR